MRAPYDTPRETTKEHHLSDLHPHISRIARVLALKMRGRTGVLPVNLARESIGANVVFGRISGYFAFDWFKFGTYDLLPQGCSNSKINKRDEGMLSKYFSAILKRERLRLFLTGGRAFGSRWHRFSTNAPCSADQIAMFEKQWMVFLPHDFKNFLTAIGNGSAGPYYGVSCLQDWTQPWEDTRLSPTFLARAFDPAGTREAGLCPGAMRICNAGCDHYLLLIVSGQYAGQVWHDATVDGLGVFPILNSSGTPLSFADWMNEWLSALPSEKFEQQFWTAHEFKNHAVAQTLLHTEMQLETVATDQLVCPTCIRRLSKLQTLQRLIVTAEQSTGIARNPKRATILAAKGEINIFPRQILPLERPFFSRQI